MNNCLRGSEKLAKRSTVGKNPDIWNQILKIYILMSLKILYTSLIEVVIPFSINCCLV